MTDYCVITTANNKGGVGKTLLSKTLGEYAAMILGKRTLLIDLDPQTNLSRRYLDMQLLSDGSEDYAPHGILNGHPTTRIGMGFRPRRPSGSPARPFPTPRLLRTWTSSPPMHNSSPTSNW